LACWGKYIEWTIDTGLKSILTSHQFSPSNSPKNPKRQDIFPTMLSILRKARLKDKEMRILMLYVSSDALQTEILMIAHRGLDNAGKTTIVKRIMKEDVTTVSPTLGFIIKTIDFMG
jgi:predicted GTPase